MAAKRKEVNFNEFWHTLCVIAKEQELKKGQFMIACDLSPQRYSEFENAVAAKDGGRNISGRYMTLLMGGLKLTENDVEKKSGRKFTAEQKAELGLQAFIDANIELIKATKEDPQKLKIWKQICRLK